jgi:YVTN family beta-propeller protein
MGCWCLIRPVLVRVAAGCALASAVVALARGDVQAAPHAYVANVYGNTVAVIDTRTQRVDGPPIPVGNGPVGVAVHPDGSRVYVANNVSGTVSVIDPASRLVVHIIVEVGRGPTGLAVTPDGAFLFVANDLSDTVRDPCRRRRKLSARLRSPGIRERLSRPRSRSSRNRLICPSLLADATAYPTGTLVEPNWKGEPHVVDYLCRSDRSVAAGPRHRHNHGRPGSFSWSSRSSWFWFGSFRDEGLCDWPIR